MRFCAIGRTLGEHLGHVAATAASVSCASAAGASCGGSNHDTCAADTASASPARRNQQLP